MQSRRSRRRTVLLAGTLVTALLSSGAPALAGKMARSPNASCQGILSRADSNPAHDRPLDVSRSDVAQFFAHVVHAESGIPPGAFMSANAHAEGDSVEACLAATS